MTEEIWKDIEGYEGYQISSLGRVRSLDRIITHKNGKKELYRGKIRKGVKNKQGYLFLSLCKNGRSRNYFISRLVAMHFIPNPENKPYVDHIDTNPLNNRVDNLRWCTQKENMNNPISVNKISESRKGRKMTEETRKKISESHKGRKKSEETRKKMSQAQQGKIVSEETREKKYKKIIQSTRDNIFIKEYPSIKEAAKENMISITSISNALNGRAKSAGGFTWKYKEKAA